MRIKRKPWRTSSQVSRSDLRSRATGFSLKRPRVLLIADRPIPGFAALSSATRKNALQGISVSLTLQSPKTDEPRPGKGAITSAQ